MHSIRVLASRQSYNGGAQGRLRFNLMKWDELSFLEHESKKMHLHVVKTHASFSSKVMSPSTCSNPTFPCNTQVPAYRTAEAVPEIAVRASRMKMGKFRVMLTSNRTQTRGVRLVVQFVRQLLQKSVLHKQTRCVCQPALEIDRENSLASRKLMFVFTMQVGCSRLRPLTTKQRCTTKCQWNERCC